MATSRILIVDDHEFVRLGLRALIESRPEWTVCGEAASGRDAVQKARELKPDVVIIDISLPELDGIEATHQIHKELPRTDVLVFSMHQSEELARAAIDAGARAYVSKTAAGSELTKAIAALTQHKRLPAPQIRIPASEGEKPRLVDYAASPRSPVTVREREVLQLLAEGKSSKQIAAALNMRAKTVEAHRTNMMRKLNLHSLATLVRYAIRNGIVADQ